MNDRRNRILPSVDLWTALLKARASTLGSIQQHNEYEGGLFNGKGKQRREDDRREETCGQGAWWQRSGEEAQGRQEYHEDLIARFMRL